MTLQIIIISIQFWYWLSSFNYYENLYSAYCRQLLRKHSQTLHDRKGQFLSEHKKSQNGPWRASTVPRRAHSIAKGKQLGRQDSA